LHHRADDQSRRLWREDLERRLDRGDARPLALRTVRAHHRRDGNGLRDLHPLPQGPRQAALQRGLMPSIGFDGREHGARDEFARQKKVILISFAAIVIYWAALLQTVSPALYAQMASPFPYAFGGPEIVISVMLANLPFVGILAAVYFLGLAESTLLS